MTCHYTAKTAASVYGHDPAGSLSNLVPTGGAASLTGGEMLMPGVWPEEK